MKTELKAKFLQHLIQRKQDDKGFTLIELLVVIIIIGVLSAIALPNFLNQSAKAKQSEAKTTIGSVNSAQTAFRQERNSFANNISDLALGLPTATNNYTYNISGTTDLATIDATRTDSALKGYSGGVARTNNANSESVINSVICEAKTPGSNTTTPTGGGGTNVPAVCNTADATLGR